MLKFTLLVLILGLTTQVLNAVRTPVVGLPQCVLDDSSIVPYLACTTSAPSLTLSDLSFGTVNLQTNYSYSSTYSNFSNCLLSGCMNYNSVCTCSSTLATCFLGSFYSLRTGVIINGTCPFAPFNTRSSCLDTNWVPSTTTPSPVCPYFSLTLSPTTFVAGTYQGFTVSLPPTIINFTSSNLTGVYKNGSSLINLTSPAPLSWSVGFTLSSPSVVSSWDNDCFSSPPQNATSSTLVPHTLTKCQNLTSTVVNPTFTTFVEYQLVMNNNRWFRIKSILPGVTLTILYCQSLCEVFDPVQASYKLVPPGTYTQSLTLLSSYDCVITNCISKDCCDPLYVTPQEPCTYQNGIPVCVSNITYFDSSNNNFTSTRPPNSRFYCGSSSGKCYDIPDQTWTVNTLAIVLLAIIAFLSLVAVGLIFKILPWPMSSGSGLM